MKTVCLPSYHHNGFVATHALGHLYIYICNKKTHIIYLKAQIFLYVTLIFTYNYNLKTQSLGAMNNLGHLGKTKE